MWTLQGALFGLAVVTGLLGIRPVQPEDETEALIWMRNALIMLAGGFVATALSIGGGTS
jgi:hypothetical protein